jgi:hypothetical protein
MKIKPWYTVSKVAAEWARSPGEPNIDIGGTKTLILGIVIRVADEIDTGIYPFLILIFICPILFQKIPHFAVCRVSQGISATRPRDAAHIIPFLIATTVAVIVAEGILYITSSENKE